MFALREHAEVFQITQHEDRPLPVAYDALPTYDAPAPATLNAHYERLGFAELLSAEGAKATVEVCEAKGEALAAIAKLGERSGQPLAIHLLLEDPAPLAH